MRNEPEWSAPCFIRGNNAVKATTSRLRPSLATQVKLPKSAAVMTLPQVRSGKSALLATTGTLAVPTILVLKHGTASLALPHLNLKL